MRHQGRQAGTKGLQPSSPVALYREMPGEVCNISRFKKFSSFFMLFAYQIVKQKRETLFD